MAASSELKHSDESTKVREYIGFDNPSSINERALLWRVDLRLVPILIVIYLMAFLDRVNIGNALTLGLPEDLKLKGNQANIALTIFYVPYIIFEIPSNLVLRRFKPHRWLALSMFAFGLVEICQGFVESYAGLLTVRFFLGLAEAGVFPGCFYLLSMWYKRSESQKRFTIFFGSTTLAGAFGSLLSSAIQNMDGLQGKAGWRWIFILEGLLTMVLAMVSYILIPDFPEKSTWLCRDEKAFIRDRLLILDDDAASGATRKSQVIGFFKDVKAYLGALMYLGGLVVAYSLTYFLPTIVKGYHYNPISTQLHSVPPFAAAYVFSLLLSYLSDRLNHRLSFILFSLFLSITGVAILFTTHHNIPLEYGAVILVAMGIFSALPIAVCWYLMNIASDIHRALGSAWMIGVGNVGGIVATWSFRTQDAPRYRMGYGIVMGGLCVMAVAAGLYGSVCVWENRKGRGSAVGKRRLLL